MNLFSGAVRIDHVLEHALRHHCVERPGLEGHIEQIGHQ